MYRWIEKLNYTPYKKCCMKSIKDPLYGYIDIDDPYIDVIDSSKFQRLRRIKQLGFTHIVYPSAMHSRFSHSLGVMNLAQKLSDSLDMDERQTKINTYSGLLHDTGHLPYSHAIEKILNERESLSHEDLSCRLVDELSEDIDIPVSNREIKNMIRGDASRVNIISNTIDVDRIDYLMRDAHNTGMNYGNIEEESIIKFANITDNEQLAFDRKSLNSIEDMLFARMRMMRSVYAHDTVRISEKMLRRSVYYHIDQTDDSISDFIYQDDNYLHTVLENSDSNDAKRIFTNLLNRNLYKKAYIHDLNTEQEILNAIDIFETNKHEHEKNIAQMAGIDEKFVLFGNPYYKTVDEFDIYIQTGYGETKTIEKISSIPDDIRKTMIEDSNIQIYTPDKHVEEIRDCAEEYITDTLK